MQETWDSGSIPGSGRCPRGGSGSPLQYSSWRIPWTEEPGGLQSMGSQRVGHDWSNLAPKVNQLRLFIGKIDAEAEAPVVWPPNAKSQVSGKDPDDGKDWGQESKVTWQRIRWLDGITDSMDMSLRLLFSVAQSCPTLWYPMEWGTPGFPILCHLPEPAQTHAHWLSDAI